MIPDAKQVPLLEGSEARFHRRAPGLNLAELTGDPDALALANALVRVRRRTM
jgi:hypothetical protein